MEKVFVAKPSQSNEIVITPRELEVMELLSQGKTSKEISIEFNVSLKTIEVHRHSILKKTKYRNVVELVMLYLTKIKCDEQFKQKLKQTWYYLKLNNADDIPFYYMGYFNTSNKPVASISKTMALRSTEKEMIESLLNALQGFDKRWEIEIKIL
jgi:DNA-binding CsgD family transcriptional regulator